MLYWNLLFVTNLVRFTLSDEALVRLYRHLLKDYENEVRPSLRHDMPINVTFAFSLTQIIDVDERNQIITTNAWVRQDWFDYKMVWNPLNYDNVTKIHIPHKNLWLPDIILYTNAESEYSKSLMSTDVIVRYDGNVTWSTAGIFKSSCRLDVRYYPFDTQNCVLKFASWAYDGTKIDIVLGDNSADQTNYMTSTEWNLHRVYAEKNSIVYSCCPEPYPFIDIYISITRRPMFYIFNLILPCVLISGVALLGFYMPSDSGEKVTLGITSLLSTTVFLMMVAESMPPTSDALPLIGLYYGATIFIVGAATAMTVLTLNIHHCGAHGRAVPKLVQVVAFKYLARALCMSLENYHSVNQHIHYFFEKESNLSDPSQKVLDRRVSPLRIGAHRAIGELEGGRSPRSNRQSEASIFVTEDKSRKRVSFSDESLHVQTPNGACSFQKKKYSAMAGHETSSNTAEIDSFEEDFFSVLNKLHGTIERNEMRLAEKDRRNAAELEWKQVALVLDRFLLIFFVFATALTSMTILFQRHLNF